MEKKEKCKRYIVEIDKSLIDILDDIKNNINDYTWGVDVNIGYKELSKILAMKIAKRGL